MTRDKIIIRDLAVLYRVGVPEAERTRPQRLLVSVEMAGDFAAAALSDDLEKTVDYYAVSRRLLEFGVNREWRLIERLAADIADVLLREFAISSVLVEVKKFVIPEAEYVAVRLERARSLKDEAW